MYESAFYAKVWDQLRLIYTCTDFRIVFVLYIMNKIFAALEGIECNLHVTPPNNSEICIENYLNRLTRAPLKMKIFLLSFVIDTCQYENQCHDREFKIFKN